MIVIKFWTLHKFAVTKWLQVSKYLSRYSQALDGWPKAALVWVELSKKCVNHESQYQRLPFQFISATDKSICLICIIYRKLWEAVEEEEAESWAIIHSTVIGNQ